MAENENIILTDMEVTETNEQIRIDETIQVIEFNDVKAYEIETDDAFAAIGEPNEQLRHSLLTELELPNQHPIIAIEGLREELDNIEALQIIYSDKKQQADYYIWHDENVAGDNRIGYFVSMHQSTSQDEIHGTLCCIEICDGDHDVFGVTVADAGFIGGQEYAQAIDGTKVGRDHRYGLVVSSGLATVRCESDVQVGDYVTSNGNGMAKKTNGKYGYLVAAMGDINGVMHAIITLTQSSILEKSFANDVDELNKRISSAEYNITSVTNVANSAYAMAQSTKMQTDSAVGSMQGQIGEAVDKVESMGGEISDLNDRITNAAQIATNAQVIAKSAVDEAEVICVNAIAKANEALAETSNTRKDIDARIATINAELNNINLEIQTTKEDIETTYDELQSNISSISSDLETTKNNLNNTRDELKNNIDTISSELETTKTSLNSTRDTLQSNINDISSELETTKTNLNSTLGEISVNIDQITNDINEANMALETTKSQLQSSIDNTSSEVNTIKENLSTTISNIESLEEALVPLVTWPEGSTGDEVKGVAGFVAKTDDNSVMLGELVKWQGDANTAIAEVQSVANANKATLDNVAGFTYTDEEGNTSSGLAGLTLQVTANTAELSNVATYESGEAKGLAGLIAQVDANKSDILLLSQFEDDTGEGLAQLRAQVDANTAEIEAAASHTYTDADGNELKGLAAINQQVTDQEVKITQVVTLQGETSNAIAGIEQEVDANTANITTLTSWKSGVENDVASIAGIKTTANENSASIQDLVSWQSEAKSSIVEVTTTANENEASISSLNSWKDVATESLSEVTQKVGNNEASIQSLTSIQNETNQVVAEIEQRVETNEASIESITTWQGTTNNTLASIQQKTNDNEASLSSLTEWKGTTETTLTAVKQQSDANMATIENIVEWNNDTTESLANITEKVDTNESNINSLTSWKETTSEAVTNVEQKASTNEAAITNLTSWKESTSESITQIAQKANANESNIQTLTTWKNNAVQSIANVEAKASANESSVALLTQWKTDVADDVESITSIRTQSDANKSAIESLTSWKGETSESLTNIKQQSDNNKASIDTITSWQSTAETSIAEVKQQVEDNVASIQSLTEWKGTASESLASIEQRVGETESSISSLTSWRGDTNTAIANVEQKASTNESNISSLTSWKGEASTAIANVEQKATNNESAITNLTSWQDEASESIAAVEQTANKNSADISSIASWKDSVADDVTSIASIKSTADVNKASIENLVQKDTELSNSIAGVQTTADTNKASIESIVSWQSNVNPTINSVTSIEQKANDNAAEIESLTSWQGTTNTSMANLQQQADANGAKIEALVANIDKYAVGEYSQAYGLTLEQTKNILSIGTVYVPTVLHSETYNTYTQEFVLGYHYTWDGDKWVASQSTAVKFHQAYVDKSDASSNDIDYWVVTVADVVHNEVTYDLGGLYKWESNNWVKVASITDNILSRAVSAIKITTNSIETSVSAIDDKYAGTKIWVDNNKSSIQDVVTWHGNNGDSLVTFVQEAGDNFASASQVAQIVDNDGNIKAASIVTAVTNDESAIALLADNITLNADNIDFEGSEFSATMTEGITMSVSQAINNLEIGGRNLVYHDSITHTAVLIETLNRYKWRLEKASEYAGTKISDQLFKIGDTYTLSFRFQKVMSNLNYIGLHMAGYTVLNIYIDRQSYSVTDVKHGDGIRIPMDNDNSEHYVVITFTAVKEATDNNIYIQPNRYDTSHIQYDLWDIQVEKGTKATDWTPPIEDKVDNEVTGDGCSWSMTKDEFKVSAVTDGVKGSITVDKDGLTIHGAIESSNYSQGTKFYTWNKETGEKELTYTYAIDWDKITETPLEYFTLGNYNNGTNNQIIGWKDGVSIPKILKIPNIEGVVSIALGVFQGKEIEHVYIPPSITDTNANLFAKHNYIKSVYYADGASCNISTNCFQGAKKLEYLYIGNTIGIVAPNSLNVDTASDVYIICNDKTPLYQDYNCITNAKNATIHIYDLTGNASQWIKYIDQDLCIYYDYSETAPDLSHDGSFWCSEAYEQGFKLSTEDKYMIDSSHFKVTQDGQINATAGNIGGCEIVDGQLTTEKLSALSGDLGNINAGSIESSNYQSSQITIWGETTPQEGFAQDVSEDLTYELNDDGTYTVSGHNTQATQIFIPGSYENKLVTRIAEEGFANNTSITSIKLSDGIQSIGASAFAGCTNLQLIYLPETLTEIADYAFTDCPIDKIFYQGTNEDLNELLKLYISIEEILTMPRITVTPDMGVTAEGKYIISYSEKPITYMAQDGYLIISAKINDEQLTDEYIVVSKVTHPMYPDVSCYTYARLENGNIVYYRRIFGSVDSIDTSVAFMKTSLSLNGTVVKTETLSDLTYCYSATEPAEGNFWYYGGAQGFKISCEDRYMINSPYFQVTQDGKIYAESGKFTGIITADEGKIGGLYVQGDGLYSENHNFVVTSNGDVLANSFGLNTQIQTPKICSTLNIDKYINLDGFISTNITETIPIKTITYTVNYEKRKDATTHWWYGLTDPGEAIVTLNCSDHLPFDKTVCITARYHSVKSYNSGDHHYYAYVSQRIVIHPTDELQLSMVFPYKQLGKTSAMSYDATMNEDVCTIDQVSVDPDRIDVTDTKDSEIYTDAITCSSRFIPTTSGLLLGTSVYRWTLNAEIVSSKTTYEASAAIDTSDINKKSDIIYLNDEYSTFFDSLKPSTFKFIEGESQRRHIGLIAQDVKASLDACNIDTQDFAAYCSWKEDDGTETCGLRYDEFVTLNILEIQKLKKQVSELENKLAQLENNTK